MKRPPAAVPRLIPLAIGLPFALLVAKGRGLLSVAPYTRLAALSDGCFAAGLTETGFGLLILISFTGFFDIFSYAARSVLVLFTPFRKPGDLPGYADYRAMRASRRGKPGAALLVTGLLFLAVSALLLLFAHQGFLSEVL